MSNFFRNHRSSLVLRQQSPDRKGFRICQLGAIWAAKSHFTASNERALINLPTGTGKTAVMMALAFELGARRVFILTPSQFSRAQTANEFRSLGQLSNHIDVLRKELKTSPKVKEHEDELQNYDDWMKLLAFDVVVSTPNAIRALPPKKIFGSDESAKAQFDLVFVDEAHHSAANTWSEFLDQVDAARIVEFTATPFRRDRKRIRAKPIYVYPISKAIEEGVYRAVKFVPVKTTDENRRDAELAEVCRKWFLEERKNAPQIGVIIKAKDIDHAEELLNVYKEAGFEKLDVIHSGKPFKHNSDVLTKVKNNKGDDKDKEQLDGFICVDIGSEGIDVPNLRIAVFHATPQTLPYTIQVVGRVTRIDPAAKGNAILIADPDASRGAEVQALYQSDEGWTQLLPGLFQDYIDQSKFLPTPGSTLAGAASLPADDLKPYRTVRVYQELPQFSLDEKPTSTNPEVFKSAFDRNVLKGKDVQVEVFDKKYNRIIVITRSWEVPRWTTHRGFETETFDLHIYYYVKPYVFEFTTSEKIAGWIRGGFWDQESFPRASYQVIRSGLSDASNGHFLMVGMVKQSGGDSATPQYKTLMGEDVQNAIKFADGRSFSAGHAVVTTDEFTRGIAIQSGRIWSNSRDSLEQFEKWCEELAEVISRKEAIPQLEKKLMEPTEITSYPAEVEVVSILFDNSLWRAQEVNLIIDGVLIENAICFFKDWIMNRSDDTISDNTISVTLVIADQDGEPVEEIAVKHGLVAPYWSVDPTPEVRVDIDYGQSYSKDQRLMQEYLNDWPPLIVLDSGQSIRDEILFTPKIQDQRLDSDAVEAKDWSDTDITKEADLPRPQFSYNVQDKTELIIRAEYKLGTDDFLICDDRANEVADYVLIQAGKRKKITFFHCKYKTGGKGKAKDAEKKERPAEPGLNKKDLTELTEQAVRTGYWIRVPNLIKRLLGRMIDGSKLSKLKHGSMSDFKRRFTKFAPDDWSYAVTLVQPGLSRDQLISGTDPSQAEQLLIVVSDRITTDYGAKFKVWTNS
jgi:superfamily II DNA or RNA helicase